MVSSSHSCLRVEYVGDVCVVHIERQRLLDEATINKMGEGLFSLVDEHDQKKILLNMAKVEYMSSSTLGKFITLSKKLVAKQGGLVMCCLTEDIWEPLRVTQINRIWKIVAAQEEGLAEFVA